MLRNFAATLVCVVVTLAPLPFGSAEPFWGAVWCALLGVAIVLGAGSAGDNESLRTPVLLILGVVAVWCAVVALQYLPASSWVAAGPGWGEAAKILSDRSLTPKVAIYAQIPIAAAVPPLSLVMALLAGVVFGSEPKFVERLYRWVAVAGLIYAAFGIFAEIINPTMLLWREKTAYVDAVTGTFVNHNTAAVFFGSIAIIWYLRALREVRRTFDLSRWRDFAYVSHKLKNLSSFQIGYALASFVALASTFMTRSRAGSLLTLAMLLAVTGLYFARELRSTRRVLTGLVAIAVVGAIILEAAGGQFANEIGSRGVYDVGRADAWLSSLAIIRDHPWLGTGLGTFVSVFPAYRNPAGGIWGVWDHAHSAPIELLVEMGVPFGLLVFTSWAIMLAVLYRAAIRGGTNRFYVVAGCGIVTLGTLHSFVDFSLQIPGFSIVCCTLTGASLAAALVPVSTERSSRAGQEPAPAATADMAIKSSMSTS